MSTSCQVEVYSNETLPPQTELWNEFPLFGVSHSWLEAIFPFFTPYFEVKIRGHCFRHHGLGTHGTGIRESTNPRWEGRVQLELKGSVFSNSPVWFVFGDLGHHRDTTRER